MKTHLFTGLAGATLFALLVNVAHGENLLTNGDFETNAFTPWIATGNAQITTGLLAFYGMHSCGLGTDSNAMPDGKIEQTVATTAGATYYLALDIVTPFADPVADFTFSGIPASGGPADGSRQFQTNSASAHYTLVFKASTASTKISIARSGAPSVIDNIQLLELPRSKFAGKYTGTAQTVLHSEISGLTNKATVKLTARIASTGQIVLLEGANEFAAGILLPDGTLDIRLHGLRRTFTPTIRGGRISFFLNIQGTNLLDEGLNQLDPSAKTTYTLTRVK